MHKKQLCSGMNLQLPALTKDMREATAFIYDENMCWWLLPVAGVGA